MTETQNIPDSIGADECMTAEQIAEFEKRNPDLELAELDPAQWAQVEERCALQNISYQWKRATPEQKLRVNTAEQIKDEVREASVDRTNMELLFDSENNDRSDSDLPDFARFHDMKGHLEQIKRDYHPKDQFEYRYWSAREDGTLYSRGAGGSIGELLQCIHLVPVRSYQIYQTSKHE